MTISLFYFGGGGGVFFKESVWCTNLESLCVGSSTSKLDFPHLFKNKKDNIISLSPEKVVYT